QRRTSRAASAEPRRDRRRDGLSQRGDETKKAARGEAPRRRESHERRDWSAIVAVAARAIVVAAVIPVAVTVVGRVAGLEDFPQHVVAVLLAPEDPPLAVEGTRRPRAEEALDRRVAVRDVDARDL